MGKKWRKRLKEHTKSDEGTYTKKRKKGIIVDLLGISGFMSKAAR